MILADLVAPYERPLVLLAEHPAIAVGVGVATIVAGLVAIAVASRRPALPLDQAAPDAIAAAARPTDDGSIGAMRKALGRTRDALQGRFDLLFGGRPIDEALFDELETTLLSADVGTATSARLLAKVRDAAAAGNRDPASLRAILREEMKAILDQGDRSLDARGVKPWVILVVGVNGSGKTTTIGKLASRLGADGQRVLMAAGDTFRAAAAEQLTIWAERAKCEIVSQNEGADPGAVVFDALTKAVAKGHDVVIIDTAGRLQTKKPLMDQLAKLRRVIDKVVPGGPHETLLVIDGTMGQNALSQAKLFHEATPLTGVVITKLDGTAKGGMVLTLAAELGLPVKFVGVGERVEDLRSFEPNVFVEALA